MRMPYPIDTPDEVRIELAGEMFAAGMPCGPAFVDALGRVFGVEIGHQIHRQSLMFSEGGGVGDRCAAFQACVAIVGLAFGRSDTAEDIRAVRGLNRRIADTFNEDLGGYLCCGAQACDATQKESRMRCATHALRRAFEEGAVLMDRCEKFKVNPRLRACATAIMTEDDWRFVDAADENRLIDETLFTDEECERAYRRGVLRKRSAAEDGHRYELGMFHTRIDCCLRGERELFESLSPEMRAAIVEYEQDISLWVLPRREEGKNQKVVYPMPLEHALEFIDSLDCRFYLQECDCKIYREGGNELYETCLHFFDDDSLANTNLDRGHAREISKDEAKDLLRRADEAGYIHNYDGHGMCNCCGCCCWAVRGIKDYRAAGYDVFSEYVYAEYAIAVDAEKCASCGACMRQCPVGALSMGDDSVVCDYALCVGCGVCRAKCRFDALSIVKRGE